MHPVERGNYVIPTRSLENWVNAVLMWIESDVLGAITPGRPRIGKSFAIRYFIKNYRAWLGDTIAVVSVEIRRHRSPTERLFFGDLLDTMGHPTTKHDLEIRRKLFIGRLVEAADRSSARRLVVFVDEAQHLDSFTLDWLSAVHNDLVRLHNIKCIWLLVGQAQLHAVRQILIAEGKTQLVARFMRGAWDFGALCAKDDFRYCVGCYDKMRYPEKDGPTFAGHFAPDLVASGYTLESDNEIILSTLQEEAQANGISTCDELCMEAFVSVMNHILKNQLTKLSVGQHLTADMVRASAAETSWIDLEKDSFLAEELARAA